MITKKAIIAGNICLDITPNLSAVPEGQFSALLQPGRLIHADGVRLTPGGAVSNTGRALVKLGVPVQLIGKIGDDAFGEVLSSLLEAEGPHLAENLVIDLSMPTSYTIVLNPPGFDRAFIHAPGANNTFYASDLPRAILQDADLLHFGYPSVMRSIYRGDGAELVSILQRARRAGLTTSLDFTLPDHTSPAGIVDWPLILENSLPLVDLFLPSVEELTFLLDRETYDRLQDDQTAAFVDQVEPALLHRLSDIVLGYGVKAVMIKLGHRGVYLRTGGAKQWAKAGRALDNLDVRWHSREMWVPAFSIEEHGTTGAGDAAAAGFIAGVLRGLQPETALQMAAAAGANCVESPEGVGGLDGWDDMSARVTAGWETLPLNVNGEGWRKDISNGIWEKA